MEIIVKKDILDELQAKGVCHSREEADSFLKENINELAEKIRTGNKVYLEGFGSFLTAHRQGQEQNLIDIENFVDKIAQLTSIDKERAEMALRLLAHFIKEMLIKGHEVQLIEFASFRIEEKKAQIVKLRTGQRTVMPAKKVLIFEPDQEFSQKADNQEIQFEPDGEFREQIERLKSSSILLVVPKRDFFVKTIEYHFDKAGWKVNTAQTTNEAKRLVKGSRPHLIVVDSLVEQHQDFCETMKSDLDTTLIPLIIMYPKSTDLKKADYFRVCGDEHVIQPFELKHLLNLAESVLRRASEEEAIFRQEVLLQFPTIDKYIDKTNELCSRLFAKSGLTEEEHVTLNAAFREALANAAQHGNKHRRDKLLEVLYLLDKERIIIAVTDSGRGFDWQNFISTSKGKDAIGRARQSHSEGKMGGLGIMLMSRCVDHIEYNDTGNVITLTKSVAKSSI